MINKDTQLCMSLSGRPGNFGTTFHNYLYQKLGLNFIYKAFTTTDIESAVKGIRALGIRGCAVSMPFKESCMPFLDEISPSVQGSGGMAKAVVAAFKNSGFEHLKIFARNEKTGKNLAALYGYEYISSLDNQSADILVNVTPIGMKGGKEEFDLAFPKNLIQQAQTAFDVVAIPAETPFIQFAQQQGKQTISGAEVIVLQAVEQFELYTGIRPDDQLIAEAAAFARKNS